MEPTPPSARSIGARSIGAGPLRRLGAMLYDALLVVAVEFVAALPFLPLLPHGKVMVFEDVGALAYAFRLWQVVVVCGFFGFFWTRRGRTLGMQAWGLRVQTLEGGLPSWRDALLRVLCAAVPWLPAYVALSAADWYALPWLRIVGCVLLTLGVANYLAAWLDPERCSVHDRWLRTRIVLSASGAR